MTTTENLGLTKPDARSVSWGSAVNTNWDTLDANLPKCNFTGTAAPGTGDDVNDGYAVGSRWLDTTNDKAYVCLDASVGAAVWAETSRGHAGELRLVEASSTPGTPSEGEVALYAIDDNSIGGQLVSKNDGGVERFVGCPYIHIRDEKSSGTEGGASSAQTWNVRDLNTEVTDTHGHASLSSNQITLTPGTYRIRASAPGWGGGRHKLRLRNVTDGTTVLVGSNGYATGGTTTSAITNLLAGEFTIAASKALELQHYTYSAQATNGLGVKASTGEVEVYAVVELWKVKE